MCITIAMGGCKKRPKGALSKDHFLIVAQQTNIPTEEPVIEQSTNEEEQQQNKQEEYQQEQEENVQQEEQVPEGC